MTLKRIFTTEGFKCTRNYIDSQKKYEIIRTVLYFAVSLSLFVSGWITTGSRNNLLTIVAVLGCLPASKSLVESIMYCKYHSLKSELVSEFEAHSEGLTCLYDCVFTTREKTYPVGHIAIQGNTVIGFLTTDKFSENDCAKHLDTSLKVDQIKGVTVKIFKDPKKYADRLEQIRQLPQDPALAERVAAVLISVAL